MCRRLKVLFIRLILTYACYSSTNIYAQQTALETIVDTLTRLTCQTQGVGDLMRSEFSHTCIPAPFSTFAVYNIVSPGLFINTMLALKLNDDSLFPGNDSPQGKDQEQQPRDVPFSGGACARKNRISYKDPVISFALCRNTKLTLYNATAVGKAAIAIAKSIVTGESPWDDIMQSLQNDRREYHEFFYNRPEGDEGVLWDFPLPHAWKIIRIDDRLCVATKSITGYIPVGCKYIKEPHPRSRYASFMDLSDAPDTTYKDDEMLLTKCSNTGSCYRRAYNNSKTAIVITSPLIECIREMIVRLIVSRDVCSFKDISLVINSAKRETSSFFVFQRNMQKAVTAFLTLYVIIFGFKIVLTGDVPPKSELINFVLKVIFVTYFSVGININSNSTSDYGRLDGMIEWAFPFLLGGINQLASWIMNASPSSLCKFDTSLYSPDLAHLALWDAVDCRVSHYLGLDMIATILVENQAKLETGGKFDFFSFSIPPYIYLLIPALISGNMTLVSLALMYPLLVISVGAYLVNSTVVCMIGIVILGILSPLFVPMMLFQYTKGYFQSWVKLMISFLLQPMVVVVFMTTVFSIYDFGFYGDCQYKSSELKSEGRPVKIFYIDNNWNGYKSDEEVKSCQRSLGYILNNPVQAAYNLSSDVVDEQMVKITDKTEQHTGKFDFLKGALAFSPGIMIALSPGLVFERIKDMILSLITACFSLYLMYHFSAQLSQFAADMTEGVDLSNVTINPQSVYKAGMAALNTAGKMKGGADKLAAGGRGGAGDKMSGGDAKDADDKISTGDNAEDGDSAEDQVSLGEEQGNSGGEDRVVTGGGGKSGRSRSNAVTSRTGNTDNTSKTARDTGISDDALEGVRTMFEQAEASLKLDEKSSLKESEQQKSQSTEGADYVQIDGVKRPEGTGELPGKIDYVSKFNEAVNSEEKQGIISEIVQDKTLSANDKKDIVDTLHKNLSKVSGDKNPGDKDHKKVMDSLVEARTSIGEFDKLQAQLYQSKNGDN
jgi:type IV secretion system protein VirB6